VTKTYDGGTTYTTTGGNLTSITASGPLVGGDTVTAATISYANRNAGAGNKVVTLDAATVTDGNGGNNYTVTLAGNATSTINPLAVTLTAPSVTKTYDGGTTYTTTGGNLTSITASGPLVGGDTVTAATIAYADKNVGAGNKTVNLNAATISDGNGGNNYTVTLAGNSTSTITRLPSVSWVGGGTGNWSVAANWAGNAIPDLGNVADVNLNGATVTFNAAVPGPVQVNNVANGGLVMPSGTLNVSTALSVTGQMTQTGGTLTVGGATTVNTPATPIFLTGTNNNFTGAVSLTGSTAQISDINNLTVNPASLTGLLTVNAPGIVAVTAPGSLQLAFTGTNPSSLTATAGGLLEVGAVNTGSGAISLTGTSIVSYLGGMVQTTGLMTLTASNGIVAPYLLLNADNLDLQGTALDWLFATGTNPVGAPSARTAPGEKPATFTSISATDPGFSAGVFAGPTWVASSSSTRAAAAASTAAATAAAAAADEAANTFGTDSVAEQIEYGFAGDVGTLPPIDHRLQGVGISVPRCFNESREGESC
jgi:hypothetical protein